DFIPYTLHFTLSTSPDLPNCGKAVVPLRAHAESLACILIVSWTPHLPFLTTMRRQHRPCRKCTGVSLSLPAPVFGGSSWPSRGRDFWWRSDTWTPAIGPPTSPVGRVSPINSFPS